MNKLRFTFAIILTAIGITCNPIAYHKSAHAACAWRWKIGNESVNFCNGTSENGTFSSKLEENSEGNLVATITLDNYKGQAFYIEGFGSGIPVTKYIVKLIGSNEVVLDDIDKTYNGEMSYELTGDGQLVVRSNDKTTDCTTILPDEKPIEEGTISPGNHEDWPDDALIGPTPELKPKNTWDIILWFIVRIAIFGSFIAIGVFGTLGIIWLRNKKSPQKQTKKR